jgi:hypothetical protein
MQAIEFEATPFQYTIRVSNYIPDGVSLRVLLALGFITLFDYSILQVFL